MTSTRCGCSRASACRPCSASAIAIFYRAHEKAVEGESGAEETERRRVLRAYAVFNADQCDGLPASFRPQQLPVGEDSEGREERLDAFFGRIGAALRHQGNEAYYEPLADRITMPPAPVFESHHRYYATLAHELSHWTGHPTRLDRNMKGRFGSEAYAAEELVAVLSAAIMGSELGLPVAHLDSHASYIAHWLSLLKSDDRAILTAAAKAEEAATLLLRLGGQPIERQSRGDTGLAETA